MKREADARDDSELIRRCQENDQAALETLTKRYYQKVYSMAYLTIHNRDAALDISQEAFVRVFRNIGRFEPERSFPAWLYRIVKNLCLNYRQRQQRRWKVWSDFWRPGMAGSNPEESFWGESREPGPAEALENSERQRLLWQAIRTLPAKEKEILILREFQEMSYREIAEALEIPLGSVMSGLYQARRKLAVILGAAQPDLKGDL